MVRPLVCQFLHRGVLVANAIRARTIGYMVLEALKTCYCIRTHHRPAFSAIFSSITHRQIPIKTCLRPFEAYDIIFQLLNDLVRRLCTTWARVRLYRLFWKTSRSARRMITASCKSKCRCISFTGAQLKGFSMLHVFYSSLIVVLLPRWLLLVTCLTNRPTYLW